jgi:hypothetical protein
MVNNLNNTIEVKINNMENKLMKKFQNDLKDHGDRNAQKIKDTIKLLGLSLYEIDKKGKTQIDEINNSMLILTNNSPLVNKRPKNNELLIDEDEEMDRETFFKSQCQ